MSGTQGAGIAGLFLACLIVPAIAVSQAPAAQKATRAASSEQSGSGLGLDLGGDSKKPIAIEADQGIEWQQNNHVYIARGHATAKRGNGTITADTLTAHYRQAAKPAPGQTASAGKSDELDGSTQIYLVEADGHVQLGTETQHAYGDHAVYDVDAGTMVLTGNNLKLVTKQDTVTARDSLEWHDKDQLAVARGDAVALRDQKRIRSDVMTAEVARDEKGVQHISRIDAQGDVIVSSQDQTGRGDSGVYNVDTGITTLIGHVKLNRGQNELRGQYAVVDLNKNIYRLLGAPPSDTLTAGRPARVEGLFIPRQQPSAPAPGKP
jgi:lipopolysaccharide export system protein LptA